MTTEPLALTGGGFFVKAAREAPLEISRRRPDAALALLRRFLVSGGAPADLMNKGMYNLLLIKRTRVST